MIRKEISMRHTLFETFEAVKSAKASAEMLLYFHSALDSCCFVMYKLEYDKQTSKVKLTPYSDDSAHTILRKDSGYSKARIDSLSTIECLEDYAQLLIESNIVVLSSSNGAIQFLLNLLEEHPTDKLLSNNVIHKQILECFREVTPSPKPNFRQ
jgi:hypothetical protein